MDGIGNSGYSVRQTNLQSFFAIYGDVTRPASAPGQAARVGPLDRFKAWPIVDEKMARSAGASDASFPARILSAVQSGISREPEQALDSQSHFNLQNVVALMSVM